MEPTRTRVDTSADQGPEQGSESASAQSSAQQEQLAAQASSEGVRPNAPVVMKAQDVTISYDGVPAIRDVRMDIRQHEITALIGPSGCGKSTLLRAFNRTNDLIPAASMEGTILYHDHDLYEKRVDPVEVRRRIGMVFQKPNPFPKSIRENILFGPKVTGMTFDADEILERSLRRAALWEEVKDKLDHSAYGLSGGQQQRLCIARAIAVDPEVILMDEPCSALDPVATARIEDLMRELKESYTIVIVTHNMQQAARASDRTAFFTTEVSTDEGQDRRSGRLVEYDLTDTIFKNPNDSRTEDYVTGRFG